MGFSREEFVRVLPKALAGYRIESGGGNRWCISDPDRNLRAELSIEPGESRRIGALNLPVLRVELEFTVGTEARRQEFLRRFERGFHKGGG